MAALVLVTRPQPDADAWVARLSEAGIRAQALPLMQIEPAREPERLRSAWANLPGQDAVMFVSRVAVAHFFAASGPGGRWPAGPRAWAPGPGSAQALRDAGVPGARIDAPPPGGERFDSQALWPIVAPQVGAGTRVLIVRGEDALADAREGAPRPDWLGEQLAQRGARVESVVAYRRTGPRWDEAQCATARAHARSGALWLFTSALALRNLAGLLPGQDWRGARAMATHPRIAQAVRAMGFGDVTTVPAEFARVVASIESGA